VETKSEHIKILKECGFTDKEIVAFFKCVDVVRRFQKDGEADVKKELKEIIVGDRDDISKNQV